MKQKLKKITSGLLSAVMVLTAAAGLLPAVSVPAEAVPMSNVLGYYYSIGEVEVSTYAELYHYLTSRDNVKIVLTDDIKGEINRESGSVDYGALIIIAWDTVKILDLNGHTIDIANNDIRYNYISAQLLDMDDVRWEFDDKYCIDEEKEKYNESKYSYWRPSSSSLIEIPENSVLYLEDSGNGGAIKHDNNKGSKMDEDYIWDHTVNVYNRYTTGSGINHVNGDEYYKHDVILRADYRQAERNVFDNYGTLIINGGTVEAGSSYDVNYNTHYNEDGDAWIFSYKKIYTTSFASGQITGSAVVARDGSRTVVNGGKLYGRGYHIMDFQFLGETKYDDYKWSAGVQPNSVVRMHGDAEVTVNNGVFQGKGGANIFGTYEPVYESLGDLHMKSTFTDKDDINLTLNGGEYSFHKVEDMVWGVDYRALGGRYGVLGVPDSVWENNCDQMQLVYDGKIYEAGDGFPLQTWNELEVYDDSDGYCLYRGGNTSFLPLDATSGDGKKITFRRKGGEPYKTSIRTSLYSAVDDHDVYEFENDTSNRITWNPPEEGEMSYISDLIFDVSHVQFYKGAEYLDDYQLDVTWTVKNSDASETYVWETSFEEELVNQPYNDPGNIVSSLLRPNAALLRGGLRETTSGEVIDWNGDGKAWTVTCTVTEGIPETPPKGVIYTGVYRRDAVTTTNPLIIHLTDVPTTEAQLDASALDFEFYPQDGGYVLRVLPEDPKDLSPEIKSCYYTLDVECPADSDKNQSIEFYSTYTFIPGEKLTLPYGNLKLTLTWHIVDSTGREITLRRSAPQAVLYGIRADRPNSYDDLIIHNINGEKAVYITETDLANDNIRFTIYNEYYFEYFDQFTHQNLTWEKSPIGEEAEYYEEVSNNINNGYAWNLNVSLEPGYKYRYVYTYEGIRFLSEPLAVYSATDYEYDLRVTLNVPDKYVMKDDTDKYAEIFLGEDVLFNEAGELNRYLKIMGTTKYGYETNYSDDIIIDVLNLTMAERQELRETQTLTLPLFDLLIVEEDDASAECNFRVRVWVSDVSRDEWKNGSNYYSDWVAVDVSSGLPTDVKIYGMNVALSDFNNTYAKPAKRVEELGKAYDLSARIMPEETANRVTSVEWYVPDGYNFGGEWQDDLEEAIANRTTQGNTETCPTPREYFTEGSNPFVKLNSSTGEITLLKYSPVPVPVVVEAAYVDEDGDKRIMTAMTYIAFPVNTINVEYSSAGIVPGKNVLNAEVSEKWFDEEWNKVPFDIRHSWVSGVENSNFMANVPVRVKFDVTPKTCYFFDSTVPEDITVIATDLANGRSTTYNGSQLEGSIDEVAGTNVFTFYLDLGITWEDDVNKVDQVNIAFPDPTIGPVGQKIYLYNPESVYRHLEIETEGVSVGSIDNMQVLDAGGNSLEYGHQYDEEQPYTLVFRAIVDQDNDYFTTPDCTFFVNGELAEWEWLDERNVEIRYIFWPGHQPGVGGTGEATTVIAESEEFEPVAGEAPKGRPLLYKVEYNPNSGIYEVVTDEEGNAVVSEAYVSQILWFEDKNGDMWYNDGELMTTDYFKANTGYGVLFGVSHRDAEEGYTIDMGNSEVRMPGAEYGMDQAWVTVPVETDAEGNTTETKSFAMYSHVFEATGDFQKQMSGDVNGDEEVTMADALYLLRYSILPERYPLSDEHADYNNDGFINAEDAAYLSHHIQNPEAYPFMNE